MALTNFKKIHLSVFAKILVVFVAAIFPLYIFNIQLILSGQNNVRIEIAESTKSRVSFYLSSVEREIENIISMESSLINNEHFKKIDSGFYQMDTYQQFNSMNLFRDKLIEIKSMNKYVQGITVFFPRASIKISEMNILNMDMEEYNKMHSLFVVNSFPFTMQGDDIYINMTPDIYKLVKDSELDTPCIISVKIKREKLAASLREFIGDSQGGAFLISSPDGINVNDGSDNEVFAKLKQYFNSKNISDENANVDVVEIDRQNYILCYKKSNFLHSVLITYLPEEQLLKTLSRYKTNLWIISGLTVIIVALFTLWIKSMISRPLQKLILAFRKLEKGDFNITVKYRRQDEFGYIYSQFNDMFERLRTLIEQVYEQRIHVKNAELKQLQYQINPHFLYNSILISYSLVRMKDYDCAMKLLQHLGNYYQYITRSKADEVPLSFEINHAKDYVEIQNIRFENRIAVSFGELPEKYRDMLVPRLILQPIIENSYNHGLHEKISGGELDIRFSESDAAFDIFVEDNGGIDDENFEKIKNSLSATTQNFESTGLYNVHRRLQIKYGNGSGLIFYRKQDGGLCVTLHIEQCQHSPPL